MIIDYENIRGTILEMRQIEKDIYYFKLDLLNGIVAEFQASLYAIKIADCIGNKDILSNVKRE